MYLQAQSGRLGASHQRRGLPTPSGSRILVVSHARRRSVAKELEELKQMKTSPAPAPTAPPASPEPTPAPSPPAPSAPAATTAAPASTQERPASPPASAPTAAASTPTPSSSTSSTSTSSRASGGGGSDVGLLVRILGTATGVMAVIGVFYSLVFVGGSNAVYALLKDPITSFTKKDFVPYSERRRLEQEVMAKLEEQERQQRLLAGGEVAGAAGGQEGGLVAPPLADGATDSSELMTLLPGARK